MGTRMKDIANELGVSLMTISKALRGHRDISDETRERVLKRARELGYKPNWVARSLVTGRTHLIGLVIPDLMHSFFAEVAKGVGRKLEPLGYYTVILNSEESAAAEEGQIQMLMARSVEGLIVAHEQEDRLAYSTAPRRIERDGILRAQEYGGASPRVTARPRSDPAGRVREASPRL